MHAIIWSNGERTTARTWAAMFEKVRASQWRELDEQEFRTELAKRAYVWSRTEIDPYGTYRELFYELARAGLVVIEGAWK